MPPRLLAITPPEGFVEPTVVEASVQTGVPVSILLRTPAADPTTVLARGGRLDALRVRATEAGLDVLLACDAHQLDASIEVARDAGLRGVQLRGDPDVEQLLRARTAWPEAIVGASVHGDPPPRPSPADYVVLAPVFAPNTPAAFPKPAAGLQALARWRGHGHVLALGGVTVDNAAACFSQGARGLAGISTFLGTVQEVADTLEALASALAHACDVSPPP